MSRDLHTALAVAYRHIKATDTTEAEADAILEAIVHHLPNAEAEAAAALLHHRRAERALQLQLDGLIHQRARSA